MPGPSEGADTIFRKSTPMRIEVPDITEAGRIFIREETLLPKTLQIESEPYMSGWRSVKNLDGYGLGRKIHAAGWTIFCLAYETKAIVFGIDGEKMVRRAIERILANRTPEKFNSLEIVWVASLASKQFLGIHHVTVAAQSRHIQESPVIFQIKNQDFEGAIPIGIELHPDRRVGLSPSEELLSDEIGTPSLETVRI
jgi:hypothetical protein